MPASAEVAPSRSIQASENPEPQDRRRRGRSAELQWTMANNDRVAVLFQNFSPDNRANDLVVHAQNPSLGLLGGGSERLFFGDFPIAMGHVFNRLPPGFGYLHCHLLFAGSTIAGFCTLGLAAIPERHGTIDAKLPHFVDQGRPFHSESFCSAIVAAYDPLAGFERADDMISLQFFKAGCCQIGSPVSTEWFQFGDWGP
jgi:hypothetical protein